MTSNLWVGENIIKSEPEDVDLITKKETEAEENYVFADNFVDINAIKSDSDIKSEDDLPSEERSPLFQEVKKPTSSYKTSSNVEKNRQIISDRENTESKNARKKIKYKDKINVCLYCNEKHTKLPRHLMTMHQDEDDIKLLLKYPKGSVERNKIIEMLRKQGNFEYNTRQHPDELVLTRVPRQKMWDPENYKPCPNCRGFYSVRSFRKHHARCAIVHKKGESVLVVPSRSIGSRVHEKACPMLREVIIPAMREDRIGKLVRNDEFVITMGNRYCAKYKSDDHLNIIKQKLRLLARFISAFNGEEDDKCLRDILQPENMDSIAQAIEKVGKTLALVSLLKECSRVLVKEYTENGDFDKKEKALDMLGLLKVKCPRENSGPQTGDVSQTLAETNLLKDARVLAVCKHQNPDLPSQSDELKCEINHESTRSENESDNLKIKRFSECKRAWTPPEKQVICKYFQRNISKNIQPSLTKCAEAIRKHAVLKHRDAPGLKAFVCNLIRKKSLVGLNFVGRVPNYWTYKEKKAMNTVFKDHLQKHIYPKTKEFREAAMKHPELQNRAPSTMRSYIQNVFRKVEYNLQFL